MRMERTRINNVLRNIIFASLNGVIGTLLPFVVRTYTIRYLGSEYMGLNNLCASILLVLSATDMGVANAFAFRLYKPIAQNDKEEVCRLLNFYKKIYSAIGVIIFGVGIFILPFLKNFISQNIPHGVNIYMVFFIYLINTVISYTFFAYKNLLFIADQRKDYESIITSITFGILYISQIFFIASHKYYASVCILPVCTLLCNLMRNRIALRKYPDYIPQGMVSKSGIENMKRDIFSVAVYKFRDISRNAFDNIVLSAFQGLVVLSDYQNYYMVLTVPIWILNILYSSILPSVGNYAVFCSREEMYRVYKKNVFIMMYMSAWFSICYGYLIQDFIVLWLGEEFKLSWAVVMLFAVYIYLQGEVMSIKIMRESIGLWNQGRIWAGFEMVVNLVLNVVLVLWFGVEGVILSTIISILCISIPVENRIIFSLYFDGKGKDKAKSMVVHAAWAGGTALVVGACCVFTPQEQYMGFMYKVCICALIPLLSGTLCFSGTEEFQFVKNVIVRR